MIIGHNIVHA